MTHKVLVLGDCHVKKRTWTNYSRINSDAYAALDKLASATISNLSVYEAADGVVLCGDTFDTDRPASEDVLRVVRFLEKFKNVFYIRGNHDSVSPSWLEVLRLNSAVNLVELSRQPVHLAGVPFYGCCETNDRDTLLAFLSDVADELRAGNQHDAVVVLHTGFKHLMGIEHGYSLELANTAEIFKGLHVTILVGHIHRQNIVFHPSNPDVTVYSPGSLYPTAWDVTTEPARAALLDYTTEEFSPAITEYIDTKVRQYFSVAYRDNAQFAEALKNLPVSADYQLLPVVRVTVPRGVVLNANDYPGFLLMAVPERAEQVTAVTSAPVQVGTSLEDAVAGEFPDDEECRDMALTLLSSDDPLGVLDEWLNYWKVERVAHV